MANPRNSQDMVSAALREAWRGFWAVALFSSGVNILMLAGPLYMLQVYDRVLASYSVPTLIALTIFLVAAYGFQALLEIIRARIVVRLAHLIDDRLELLVHRYVVLSAASGLQREATQPVRDLDQIRSFLFSAGPIAIVDLPWVPVFLFIAYLIHPMLCAVAVAGALILMVLALLTERASRPLSKVLAEEGTTRTLALEARKRNAESATAMGMQAALASRWADVNRRYVEALQRSTDVVGGFSTTSRVVRLLLQSAILGVGAYLVIRGELSPGAMIAASIMTGRALAPIEVVIGNWRSFLSARQSVGKLREALRRLPTFSAATDLPPPRQRLDVEGLAVGAPGSRTALVSRVQFSLTAGEALGVIGPSGSGKSSLGRALVGIWAPLNGSIRLDGATLSQWGSERLGPHVGYLSQAIELFDGTVAENIARLEPEPDSAAVIAAAVAANVHETILQLPNGYDTQIGDSGAALSAGQRQRIGLARALYRNPPFIVLDEPNSNLDAAGENALLDAVRGAKGRGAMVVIITHKPSVMSVCDKTLVLTDGQQKAFGPRDAVLRQVLVQPVGRTAPPPPDEGVGSMAS